MKSSGEVNKNVDLKIKDLEGQLKKLRKLRTVLIEFPNNKVTEYRQMLIESAMVFVGSFTCKQLYFKVSELNPREHFSPASIKQYICKCSKVKNPIFVRTFLGVGQMPSKYKLNSTEFTND